MEPNFQIKDRIVLLHPINHQNAKHCISIMNKQKESSNSRRTKSNSHLSNLYGDALSMAKIPPKAVELEEAILGAIMIEKQALDSVVDILKPESFYVDAHQRIYRAIQFLYSNTKPVDVLTVAEQLRLNADLEMIGGAYYLAELTNKVATGANAEYHSRIVSEKYIQRELIRISTDIINDSYDDTTDVFDLLDKAEKNLFAIAEENLRRSGDEISSSIDQEIKALQKRLETKGQLTGVGSGFTNLDRLTNGWQPSDLIILAARPGMGKTSMALALARNAAVELSKPVVFFSLEMNSNQLVQRLISLEAEVRLESLRRGDLQAHEVVELTYKIDRLKQANIIIDDSPGLNIFELRAKCRRYKEKYRIEMVMIDYLQLMSGSSPDGKSGGNREQEISQISRSLKSIAKELNIPVIALSQLNRSVETRGGAKRPQLSDLRESGAIEQDADMVIFLYRQEYYKMDNPQEMEPDGVSEIIVAKHRNGATGTIKTQFIKEYAKFVDMPELDSFHGEFNPNTQNNEGGFKHYSSRANEMDIDEESLE